jgi:anthranilate synthase component 2
MLPSGSGAVGGPTVLLVDNYDSFTFNLAQYLGELGAAVRVCRSDDPALDEVAARPPDRLVISPGPGRPTDAGASLRLIERFAGRVPILGVCLGHQAIGEAFGGRVERAPAIVHGKVSNVHHDGRTLFVGLDNPLVAMRYHSLVVAREGLPACLEVSAWTADGLVMGLRHRRYRVEGVQFHPESVLTGCGKALLRRFLDP